VKTKTLSKSKARRELPRIVQKQNEKGLRRKTNSQVEMYQLIGCNRHRPIIGRLASDNNRYRPIIGAGQLSADTYYLFIFSVDY